MDLKHFCFRKLFQDWLIWIQWRTLGKDLIMEEADSKNHCYVKKYSW